MVAGPQAAGRNQDVAELAPCQWGVRQMQG